jgi:hypothetical protein
MKNALKPIVNIGTKRKLQQTLGDAPKMKTSKQRQPSMPLQVRGTTVTGMKRRTVSRMSSITSTEASDVAMPKSVSRESFKGKRGTQTPSNVKGHVKRRKPAAVSSRRSLNGVSVKGKTTREKLAGRRNSPETVPVSIKPSAGSVIRRGRRTAGRT